MGLKSDKWIREMCINNKMIEPFVDEQVRAGCISYGLSSYGYDIRVADEFLVFTPGVGNLAIVDPKNFDTRAMARHQGDVCIIPPNSFALARSVEYFRMPRNVLGIVLGKSSYARCGIVTNFTPLEPCFSDDTEILTSKGWRLVKDVKCGEMVMGMSSNGVAEYQPVLSKQEYNYKGHLLHFVNEWLDILVTPEHKMLVEDKKSDTDTVWYTKEARDVWHNQGYYIPQGIRFLNNNRADLIRVNDKVYDTEKLLKFFGVWLFLSLENSTYDKGNLTIGNDLLPVSVLEELEIDYIEENGNIQLKASGFLSFLLEVPYENLMHWIQLGPEIVWESFTQSLSKSKASMTTKHKHIADLVQLLALLNGKVANVEVLTETTNLNEPKRNVTYKINVKNSGTSTKLYKDSFRQQYYEGTVYDITVPNHVIYVRRNNKVAWSGNCWEGYITIEISNTTPMPAKIYANEGIAQVLFLEGDEACAVSYEDKKGKYQKQIGITLPKL